MRRRQVRAARLLAGPADRLLAAEQQEINDWLRRETSGELRLTLAWADAAESHRAAYQAAQHELLAPESPTVGSGAWCRLGRFQADSRPAGHAVQLVPPRTRNRRRD